jgi:putative ABC transport system substrate-binding protein
MDRRTFIRLASSGLLAVPFGTLAQGKVSARVGWVAIAPIPSNMAVFREAMRQRGYREGENLLIEERYARTMDEFATVIAELVRLKVDVIVTTGGVASQEAKRAAPNSPIVFLTTDPVGSGLIASLSRPGGNLTGVAIITQDFNAKRVEIIVNMVPHARKLAALGDESGALRANLVRAFWYESEAAARRYGVQLTPKIGIRSIEQVDDAFSAATRAGAGAMLTISSSYFNAYKGRVVASAARSRLPTIYEHRDFVESGGLVSYGPDLRDAGRLAASYVDRILKGAKPGDLPVEQLSKVELVINQTTAKALDLEIPQSLLLRADEIIQ